jgi:hypothetical protein
MRRGLELPRGLTIEQQAGEANVFAASRGSFNPCSDLGFDRALRRSIGKTEGKALGQGARGILLQQFLLDEVDLVSKVVIFEQAQFERLCFRLGQSGSEVGEERRAEREVFVQRRGAWTGT